MTPPTHATKDPYTRTASDLLPLLGGSNNVVAVTHCLTRLRLTLTDHHAINHTELCDHPAVLGRLHRGNALHLIVGPAAAALLAHACTELLADHTEQTTCTAENRSAGPRALLLVVPHHGQLPGLLVGLNRSVARSADHSK